jgi:hypothetical protein
MKKKNRGRKSRATVSLWPPHLLRNAHKTAYVYCGQSRFLYSTLYCPGYQLSVRLLLLACYIVFLTTNAGGQPASLPHRHFGGFVVFLCWLEVALLAAQLPGLGHHLSVFARATWDSLECCLAILPLFLGNY